MIKLKDLLVEQSILKQGMRDPKVGSKEGPIAKLQDKLIQLGYMKQIPDRDYGIYGPMTRSAVVKFQKDEFPDSPKDHDGIAGSKTLTALDKKPELTNTEPEEDPVRKKVAEKKMTKKAISILTKGLIPDFVLQFLFPTPMNDADFPWYDRKIMGAVIKNHIKFQGGDPIKDSINYSAYDPKIVELLDGPGGFDAAKFGNVLKSIVTRGYSGIKVLIKLKMALLFGRFTYELQKDGTYTILPDPYDFSRGGSIKNMPTEKEVQALKLVSGGEGFMFQLRLIQLLMTKNGMFKGKVKADSSGIDNLKALGKSLIDDGLAFSFGEWYRTMRALRSVTDPGIVGSEVPRNAMAMSDIVAPGVDVEKLQDPEADIS